MCVVTKAVVVVLRLGVEDTSAADDDCDGDPY